MKMSIDVSRQTRKFYAQANMLLRNFRYCSNEVKCSLFKSFCTNMFCCPLWFNYTSSCVKKLKCSYNSVLRRLLCISMPYSLSARILHRAPPPRLQVDQNFLTHKIVADPKMRCH